MLTLRFFRRDVALFLSLPVTLSLLVLAHAAKTSARQELPAAQAKDEASLLDGFRHVEVASVSDALEQIANKKMYMTHRMRPIFQTRFAGYALTVSLKKDANHDPDALKGMLQAIDTGTPNSVYVMVVEDGNDIAGMGGLMGTPVYALGVVPSTSVSHYRFAGSNIPVTCDGVPVNPGDIITADPDGVVVVPKGIAPQILKLAQEMDFKEHSMYAYIEKLKSILEAVAKFGRL